MRRGGIQQPAPAARAATTCWIPSLGALRVKSDARAHQQLWMPFLYLSPLAEHASSTSAASLIPAVSSLVSVGHAAASCELPSSSSMGSTMDFAAVGSSTAERCSAAYS
eukprot:CAMPEP_0170334912 /NCGR_PEP_ID=MMETSP0116_2-20130129/68492_1 /TAXON_ID=400756 /ORGANISM="Durinskia baltica, Strain CSIRO CS-38" /LENGTH=108 /DNA_ID=CAMNT_0010588287 /DNA_START=343 /DNA_END=666 /DNA_ORIENTATION=+